MSISSKMGSARPSRTAWMWVRRWFWVASGRVQFADTERARRRLDEHGIRFVGKVLQARYLEP